jgi:hypothetical protein
MVQRPPDSESAGPGRPCGGPAAVVAAAARRLARRGGSGRRDRAAFVGPGGRTGELPAPGAGPG